MCVYVYITIVKIVLYKKYCNIKIILHYTLMERLYPEKKLEW